MPPLELKPLSTLPRSSQAYRIDAIGNIQRNPNCSVNHLINVFLSPINKGIGYAQLFDTDAVDGSQQACYQISAGELFLFSPGCVIRNGQRVWTPQRATITESITISPDIISFVTPGNSSDKKEDLIPSSVYKLGLASKSPFLAIARDGDPYSILIPTMEILRFYYSGSSKLNQAIFSSKLIDLNDVLNLKKCSFDKKSATLDICLRQDYPDDDAAMIGHWYADEYAHKQVLNVWNALVKFTQMRNYNYLPLEIGFPFIGNTEIQGQGIELPTPNGVNRQRKLILTLIKCSHPRPFEKLTYRRDNQAGPGIQDTTGKGQRQTVGYRQRAVVQEEPVEPDQLDRGENDPFANPSLDIQPEQIRVNARRFPKIEIQKRDKEQSTYNGTGTSPQADGKFSNQSTSEAASGMTDAAPISIVPCEDKDEPNEGKTGESESLPVSFDTFRKVINALNNSRSITKIDDVLISSIKANTGEWMSRFPLKYSDKSDIKWSQIFKDNKIRARRAMLIKVEAKFGTHYLLEIERRENRGSDKTSTAEQEFATYLFSKKTCEPLSYAIIGLLLRSLAESAFKSYKNKFKALGLTVFSKKHQGTTNERAQLIREAMVSRWKVLHPDYSDDE